jgi:dihydrofolate reductase
MADLIARHVAVYAVLLAQAWGEYPGVALTHLSPPSGREPAALVGDESSPRLGSNRRDLTRRMRVHIVLTENCTADGVIDMTAGWFDPADQADERLLASTRAHMAEQDALLVGRRTFESFRGYWPNQTDDTTGITEHLNRIQKYVLSTTLQDPEWEPTTILRDFADVRALRDQPGRLGVTGSVSVAQQLTAEDLVDEYRLFVYPVLAGGGPGVVRDEVRLDLELVEAVPFPSGVTLLHYSRRR